MSTKEGILKVEKLKRNGWKSCGGVSNGNDLLVWKNFKREHNLPDNYDPPLKKNVYVVIILRLNALYINSGN